MSADKPILGPHDDAHQHEEEGADQHVNHCVTPSSKRALALLALGALGVVYGDIGTSPLYALRECFLEHPVTQNNVLGVVSLFFWALVLAVSYKYCSFVLQADNRGEGGVLALLALIDRKGSGSHIGRFKIFMWIGLFGAALFLADGMITPAISVLSAVEGLETITPGFNSVVVPIALAILFGLFWIQKRGTGSLGAWFGPATVIWFVSISVIGVMWIVREPRVLYALDPRYGLRFLLAGDANFFVLGSVVLCITGGEALFADLGHFGKLPIRLAWYGAVFPSLVFSYFGQGAFLLTRLGKPVGNPFYQMVPNMLLYPMVIVATLATVVASQALISGVYSLVHQAVQLGYLPRVKVVHTSRDVEGRIYLPQINAMLAIACFGLVLGFGNSSSLASAYGMSVTGTMTVTTILFFAAMYAFWGTWKTLLLSLSFLVVDLAFLGANVPKLASGGWFPLAVAVALLIVMMSWSDGVDAVRNKLKDLYSPLEEFQDAIERDKIIRVPGTAVFLAPNDNGAPPLLVHYVNHSKALHQCVVLLTMITKHIPRVSPDDRFDVVDLGKGFYRVIARYGFLESPNPLRVLRRCEKQGVPLKADEASLFVGHSTVVSVAKTNMALWRKALFEMLMRTARPASSYYRLPNNQVVEIGVRIEI